MLINEPLWKRTILRSPEDEGGGGGSYDDEGASFGSDPAPAEEDRTAKLESRLERLAASVDGFINQTKQRETESQAAQAERQIRAAEAKASQDLDAAESELASAFDEGDGKAIAAAQRKVAEAAARRERVNVLAADARERLKNSERRDGGTREDSLDTTNLDDWRSKHRSWYGIDTEMTKAVHDLDKVIRTNGRIQVGSKDYFEAIDRQMRQKFPDRFNGTPPSSGGGSGYRDPNGTATRIPASVMDGWARMGIDTSDPNVLKRMQKNRETAVSKGFLPERPVSGRILSR